jgi:hypothetical protein
MSPVHATLSVAGAVALGCAIVDHLELCSVACQRPDPGPGHRTR